MADHGKCLFWNIYTHSSLLTCNFLASLFYSLNSSCIILQIPHIVTSSWHMHSLYDHCEFNIKRVHLKSCRYFLDLHVWKWNGYSNYFRGSFVLISKLFCSGLQQGHVLAFCIWSEYQLFSCTCLSKCCSIVDL